MFVKSCRGICSARLCETRNLKKNELWQNRHFQSPIGIPTGSETHLLCRPPLNMVDLDDMILYIILSSTFNSDMLI
jgi:hypothetical protein